LIHQLSANISLNLTGHYTKGKGYFEEFKAEGDFGSYNLSTPTLFINDSTPVSSTNLVRRQWLDNDFAGGIFNIKYTAGSKLNFTLGGAYSTYFGKHYGNILWAQYIKAEEMGKQYYYNTANKNDANIYIKTNYKPMQRLNVFVDLQLRHVDYRFLGPNNSGENKTQNQRFLFFNPKLGLSYNLNEHFNLYGSGAIANKEPNRNDFVENKPQNRPKSEQLFDLEAGAKYTSSKITAAVNLYNMVYKNQLVLNGQVNDVGAAKRVNVDKSYRRGVEFEYNQNMNSYFSLGGNLTLSQNKIVRFNEYVDSSNVDYTISVSKKIEHTNSDIALSPDIISALILTIKPFKNFEITINNKYVGRQYLDNTKNTRRSIDPYQVVDLLLNYKINTKLFQEINLMCGIYNLLSKRYETNGYTYSYYYDSATLSTVNYKAPSAPINFLAGLNLKF
jgi:iron complex outermembrane receptor protein